MEAMEAEHTFVKSRMPWWIALEQEEIELLRARVLRWVEAAFRVTLGRDTEDIVQHAFAMLYRHRENVQPDNDGLYRYLCTVARRYAYDRVKTLKVRAGIAEIAARTIIARRRPAPGPELVEQIIRVREFFCNLDDVDRLVVWGHVVDGRSLREVASELDLRWRDAAEIVDRSLRRLRRWLDQPASREDS